MRMLPTQAVAVVRKQKRKKPKKKKKQQWRKQRRKCRGWHEGEGGGYYATKGLWESAENRQRQVLRAQRSKRKVGNGYRQTKKGSRSNFKVNFKVNFKSENRWRLATKGACSGSPPPSHRCPRRRNCLTCATQTATSSEECPASECVDQERRSRQHRWQRARGWRRGSTVARAAMGGW